MIPFAASAQDGGVWAYSCDHFLYGACLRVPTGMSISYESPADFGIHEVLKEQRRVLLVYEGDAPQPPSPGSSIDLKLTLPDYQLSGYRTAEGDSTRYDIFVKPGRSGVMPLHLIGTATGASQRKDLAAAVGSFRVCSFKRNHSSQTLTCPRQSVWGKPLAEWVDGLPEAAAVSE
ncbi:hypothetical protein K4043_07100 [Stenotrophomonas sp. SRS1]|nr:hypothetical protein [Stenotrophomonas sp. SRS1]